MSWRCLGWLLIEVCVPHRCVYRFIESKISLHSGQTGNFSGLREGTHTLPHRATTGVPLTIASVSFALGT